MSRREPLLLGLGLLVTLATCRDGTGPRLHYARVAVVPIFPSNAGLAGFGLSIDRVRFVVVGRVAPPDTLADTTVSVPPDAPARVLGSCDSDRLVATPLTDNGRRGPRLPPKIRHLLCSAGLGAGT